MPNRRSAGSGEFEDRQEVPAVEGGSSLGDFTDDILYERGELHIPAGQRIPRGIPGAPGGNASARHPPDVAYQQKQRDIADDPVESKMGTLSQGATVRTQFEARPINARDFIFGDEFNVPAGA